MVDTERDGALALPSGTGRDRLVLSRGNLFSVTNSSGNIIPPGARELGVFFQDTRHLSHYELVFPGPRPNLLSSETAEAVVAQIDLTVSDEVTSELDEPSSFLHMRRKQILDDEFVDQLVFTNFLGRKVDLEYEVRFGCDFADVFEVRGVRRSARGEALSTAIDGEHIELRYRGVEGEIYRTELRFCPKPVLLSNSHARLRLNLEAGETQVHEIGIIPHRGEPVSRRAPWPFDARLARVHRETEEFARRCTRTTSDNAILQTALARGLHDISALRILHDGLWIVGAGIPWFAAPFGRDSLITSLEMLAFAPTLATETLRFLGRHQGQKIDPIREEEPGRILHELRRGEMVRAKEIPHSPYYGSIDATPLYVVLASETYRFTGDRNLLGETWPFVKRAMSWIETRTSSGNQFLTYQRVSPRGLENQGWKDSRSGVSFPDGRRAQAPIALVEVQGYVLDAYRRAARLASEMGEPVLAETWKSRIEPLARRIEGAFWNEEASTFALAIDGAGQQVPTITSNPGHLLWSHAVSPERARNISEVLLGPEMYSGWGIRTVGRGQTVYNPVSYHNGSVWPHDNALCALGMARYGMRREVLITLEGMLAASEHFRYYRLPELFGGMGRGEREFLVRYPVSCSPQAWASGALFMMLQGTLGLDPDAPSRRLRIWNPCLPRSTKRVDLLGMRIGGSQVSLRFGRTGRRTHTDVLDVRGAPLRVEIEVD